MATHVPLEKPDAARHREGATKTRGQLLRGFLVRGKWHYFPMLLSDYGRMILERKYDAVATDHAYDVKPSGRWGPIGRAVDRKILHYPLHVGLRQRLALVSGFLAQEVRKRTGDVRLLSAPCGLARDIVVAAKHLGDDAKRVHWVGADLDATGEVLPLAQARAESAGLDAEFMRQDLFAAAGLEDWVRKNGKFHVANCIGLTAWMGIEDAEKLACVFRALLVKGGSFVVDNWYEHKHSKVGRDLEIRTRYHDPEAFVAAIARAGFRKVEGKDVENRTCAVYVFEAV